MKHAIIAFVLFISLPAAAGTLMTRARTPVRAEPKQGARVLCEIPQNVKIPFDERNNFWYRVSCKAEGRRVEGWVFYEHVDNMMGRTKGQLLAQNDQLYQELVELRAEVAKQKAAAEEAREELAEAKQTAQRFRDEAQAAKARTEALRSEVFQLKKALEKAGQKDS
jgi:hypothetical protein